MMPDQSFMVAQTLAGQTLAAALRGLMPELSWSAAKRLVVTRRVEVNGVLTLNDARRVDEGDVIVVHEQSLPPVPDAKQVRVLHIDPDLIVVDKPAGIVTLRRDEERHFKDQRKELQPSLDELISKLLPGARVPGGHRGKGKRFQAKRAPIYAVHRLDRDTSGLMMFALSPRARDRLIEKFSKHQVDRRYRAVVLGRIDCPMKLETWLVRDRGDGLRGSVAQAAEDAERAVTHIRPLEQVAGRFTVVECRLETGRTHQIRIHLSEAGHMICGERMYIRPRPDAPAWVDDSAAPRQALHSAELRFIHPVSGKEMFFESPLARDLRVWLEKLRNER